MKLNVTPIILNISKPESRKLFLDLKRSGVRVIDNIRPQLEELFLIRNPHYKFAPEEVPAAVLSFISSLEGKRPLDEYGNWIYLQWEHSLVHVLGKDEYYELLTSRNKNLINAEEQKLVRRSNISIAGLSVGSSIMRCLALEGFNNFYLTDFDDLSLSNMNRIFTSVSSLGENKVYIAARQVYGIYPYAHLKLFPKGLKDQVLPTFVKNADIVVDEMDDITMKYKLRQECKLRRIPLVSAADVGDSCIVDVERYDLEPNRPMFHGMLGKMALRDIQVLDFPSKAQLIGKIIGEKFLPKRNKESVQEIGKTLYTWPQLGGAAQMAGAVLTYVIKGIVTGQKVKSGKYWFDVESFFK